MLQALLCQWFCYLIVQPCSETHWTHQYLFIQGSWNITYTTHTCTQTDTHTLLINKTVTYLT